MIPLMCEVPRIVKFMETESRTVNASGLGRENEKSLLNGIEFLFCKMKNVLWMDGGWLHNVLMYLTPLNVHH